MLYDFYTVGGELYHSQKGTSWANHKYTEKKVSKNGKLYYVYKRIKEAMQKPIFEEQVKVINEFLDKNVNPALQRKQERIEEKDASHWMNDEEYEYYKNRKKRIEENKKAKRKSGETYKG